VIQDLEGATSEPTRRGHVFALSAAAAATSLVLLLALVAAPQVDTGPLAATPAPSPTAGSMVVTIASGTWVTLDQVAQLADDMILMRCAPGIGSSPPIHVVYDRTGQAVIAAYTSGKTGRYIPLPVGYAISGSLTVPCDTPDVFAPRINRAR
jgi:hypothetical protein